MKQSYILECRCIEKEYVNEENKIQVIKPTSFGLEEGSINLIIGKSGSGKTTLLSMLQGIEKPSGGNVYYREVDFYALSEEKQARIRGKKFGIIFQSFHLVPELSVMDNIKLPSIINGGNFNVKMYKQLLELLEIADKQNMYPAQLSGGQQQRVAIARAMIMNPDILFADEPTGNLDSNNSRKIAELFKKINKEYKTTIVVVTHNQELMHNPNHIFVMEDGVLSC